MNKQMRYEILTACDTESLVEYVNQSIQEDNAVPMGAPFVSQMDRYTPSKFSQAVMIPVAE